MAGPSQGLAADARGLILSEDVVYWADGRDGGAALGLVYRVAGQSDDEALSDSGDDEVCAARESCARGAAHWALRSGA